MINQVDKIDLNIKNLLSTVLPRDVYKRLLELSRIFLGTVDHQNVYFYKPGAFHHARWMSKAIYSLKIYIFWDASEFLQEEEKSLLDNCLFVVFLYVRLDTAYEFGSPKKYFINNDNNIKNLQTNEIDYFVNSKSMAFFKRFNINKSFWNLMCKRVMKMMII